MRSKLPMILAIDAVVTIGILGTVYAYWKCNSCTPHESAVVPVTYQEPVKLTQEFAEAFRAKDVERLKALFCWDRVDAWTAGIVEQSLAEDLEHTLVDVSAIPYNVDEKLEFEVNGTRYVPNLEVTGRLKVAYQRQGEPEATWSSYLVGNRAGIPMIALSAPAQ
jgi:hypothetical protein